MLVLFAALLIGLLLIFASGPLTQTLFQPEEGLEHPAIAQFTLEKGSAEFRHPGMKSPLSVESTHSLPQNSRLILGGRSEGVLKFPSGYELRLHSEADVALELWDPENSESPSYISFAKGAFTLLKSGPLGLLYVVKEGRLYSPERPPVQAEPDFNIDQQPPVVESKPTPPEPKTQKKPKLAVNYGKFGSSDSLDNEYIDGVIRDQRLQFQKCQANALREGHSATGRLVVAFTIRPRGHVQDVRTIEDKLKNQGFEQCVHSIFQRLRFRAYYGQPIVRSYPLNFQ